MEGPPRADGEANGQGGAAAGQADIPPAGQADIPPDPTQESGTTEIMLFIWFYLVMTIDDTPSPAVYKQITILFASVHRDFGIKLAVKMFYDIVLKIEEVGIQAVLDELPSAPPPPPPPP